KVNEVRLQELHDKYEVTPIVDKQEVVTDAEVIVLSMKPKDLQSALDEIIPYLVPGQLIISVIAGIEEAHIRALIGKNIPIIRTMPNTSAMIGASATGIAQGKYKRQIHMYNKPRDFSKR